MSIDTEGETTGELDTASLGVLLQQDVERTLGGEPPTVTLERERLLGLLEATNEPRARSRPHTIPRGQLLKHETALLRLPLHDEPMLDTNLRPSLSPLVVLGVIAMLVGLFFAVMHVS